MNQPLRLAVNRDNKRKEKTCQFPDCGDIFMGSSHSKYCPEHQKKEYKHIIEEMIYNRKKANKPPEDNPNQIIQHEQHNNQEVILSCFCGKKFSINLIPQVKVYPKHCPEHRNLYKRLLYFKQHGITDEQK